MNVVLISNFVNYCFSRELFPTFVNLLVRIYWLVVPVIPAILVVLLTYFQTLYITLKTVCM